MGYSIEKKRQIASYALIMCLLLLAILTATYLLSNDKDSGFISLTDSKTLEDAQIKITDTYDERILKKSELEGIIEITNNNIKDATKLLEHDSTHAIVGTILGLVLGLIASTYILYRIEKANLFSR